MLRRSLLPRLVVSACKQKCQRVVMRSFDVRTTHEHRMGRLKYASRDTSGAPPPASGVVHRFCEHMTCVCANARSKVKGCRLSPQMCERGQHKTFDTSCREKIRIYARRVEMTDVHTFAALGSRVW